MSSNQKVAIVTGGNSGIGRATAVALAKEGVKVVIAARREKEGEETARLVKEAGSDSIFVKTDVTNEDDIKVRLTSSYYWTTATVMDGFILKWS
jgi:NAD(P)-dependent dehydrogenase (short-subunit alcohol dehydrogenase family)